MSEKRQYLHVQRVKPYHLFLLTRVDLTDGQRFRMQEVVAACQTCRCVSRRQHWLASGGVCPVCGASTSMAFRGMRELRDRGKPQVVHSRRKIQAQTIAIALLAAFLLTLFAFVLPAILQHGSTGFQKDSQGRFFYQDPAGRQYTDGSYVINNVTYHFSNGYIDGAYALNVGGTIYLTDDHGRLHHGWSVLDGKYVYADEQGMLTSRVAVDHNTQQASGGGFYDLEGLGTVFITADLKAPTGWLIHDGGLYHFEQGKPLALADMPGSFSSTGRYIPNEAGFIEVDGEPLFLHADGAVGSGLVAFEGYVYALTEQGRKQRSWTQSGISATLSPITGVIIPSSDMQLDCSGGTVILSARTGMIQTGWLLYQQHVYCTDAQGYLLTGCPSPGGKGSFDAWGCLIPTASGPFSQGGLHCYLNEDGSLLTGYVAHDGMLYAYDDEGRLMTNRLVGTIGLLGTDGAFRPYVAGMYELGGAFYCLDSSGKLLTGWQRSGKLYYFDPQTGQRSSVGALVDGNAYTLAEDGAFTPLVEGAYRLGDNTYYVNTNGEVLTGWRVLDDTLTYFDVQTGMQQPSDSTAQAQGWVQRSDGRFYVLPDGSAAQGWQAIDGEVYYFLPSTGAVATGQQMIDGQVYTFRQDGLLQPTSPLRLILDGEAVRVGTQGRLEGGVLYEAGHLYYFETQTARLAHHLPEGMTGYISALGGYIIPYQEGIYRVDSASYYLDLSGHVCTGWFTSSAWLYWADPTTGMLHADGYDSALRGSFQGGVFTPEEDGLYTADGRCFYFDRGMLTTGWIPLMDGIGYIDPESGMLLKGKRVTIDGQTRSFDENGLYQPGALQVVTLSSGRYVVNVDGKLMRERGVAFLDGHLIAYTAQGRVAQTPSEAGLNASRFSLYQGIIIPSTPGMYTIDGETYLLDASGTCATGIVCYGAHLYYFYPETGRMCVNALGHNEQGIYVPSSTGLFYYRGVPYWALDEQGSLGIGLIEQSPGSYCYADEQGRLVTGFVTLQGKRYFFQDANHRYQMAQNRFLDGTSPDDSNIYYAGPDGALITGWYEIDGRLHCFDDNGAMLYNTVRDNLYINIYGEVQ